MARLLTLPPLFLAIWAASVGGGEAPPGSDGGRYALIVGINDYTLTEFTSLKYAVRDAESLAQVLKEKGGFDVRLLTADQGVPGASGNKPFRAVLLSQLSWLTANRVGNDTLVFFFAGHGKAHDNKTYLVPMNGELKDFDKGANLDLDELRRMLATCPAKHKAVIVDCCQTTGDRGSNGSDVSKDPGARGMLTLWSCRPGQRSFEDEASQHGAFTHFLIEGLNGAADGFPQAERDQVITVDEAAAFTQVKTSEWANKVHGFNRQEPQLSRGDALPFALVGRLKGNPGTGSRDNSESKQDLAGLKARFDAQYARDEREQALATCQKAERLFGQQEPLPQDLVVMRKMSANLKDKSDSTVIAPAAPPAEAPQNSPEYRECHESLARARGLVSENDLYGAIRELQWADRRLGQRLTNLTLRTALVSDLKAEQRKVAGIALGGMAARSARLGELLRLDYEQVAQYRWWTSLLRQADAPDAEVNGWERRCPDLFTLPLLPGATLACEVPSFGKSWARLRAFGTAFDPNTMGPSDPTAALAMVGVDPDQPWVAAVHLPGIFDKDVSKVKIAIRAGIRDAETFNSYMGLIGQQELQLQHQVVAGTGVISTAQAWRESIWKYLNEDALGPLRRPGTDVSAYFDVRQWMREQDEAAIAVADDPLQASKQLGWKTARKLLDDIDAVALQVRFESNAMFLRGQLTPRKDSPLERQLDTPCLMQGDQLFRVLPETTTVAFAADPKDFSFQFLLDQVLGNMLPGEQASGGATKEEKQRIVQLVRMGLNACGPQIVGGVWQDPQNKGVALFATEVANASVVQTLDGSLFDLLTTLNNLLRRIWGGASSDRPENALLARLDPVSIGGDELRGYRIAKSGEEIRYGTAGKTLLVAVGNGDSCLHGLRLAMDRVAGREARSLSTAGWFQKTRPLFPHQAGLLLLQGSLSLQQGEGVIMYTRSLSRKAEFFVRVPPNNKNEGVQFLAKYFHPEPKPGPDGDQPPPPKPKEELTPTPVSMDVRAVDSNPQPVVSKLDDAKRSPTAMRQGYPPWDGRQTVVDYARANGLDATSHLELAPGVPLELVLIPPGTFRMGTPGGEKDRGGDEIQHTIKIPRPFYMAKCETTQKQFQAIMGMNPSKYRGDNVPVNMISWYSAAQFCDQAAERLKLGKKQLRLPTEAEWEYACRAGTTTRYFNGDEKTDLAESGWYTDNSGKQARAVGRKRPNNWGLCDMHGNVWEWCLNWYEERPEWPPIDDPRAEGNPKSGCRVQRGGSWWSYSWHCRSGNRECDSPDDADNHYGFRVVLEVQVP